MELLPELDNATIHALREMFDARFDWQMNQTSYIGIWPPTVKLGENDYLRVGEIELHAVCDKAELELHRPAMFAAWLLDQPREKSVKVWKKAKQFESAEFMDRTTEAVADIKKRRGL